jgi:hypothetical protein
MKITLLSIIKIRVQQETKNTKKTKNYHLNLHIHMHYYKHSKPSKMIFESCFM